MKNLAIFVHYNKNGSLDKRVLYALNCIRPSFDTILVVSNSKLSRKNIIKLNQYCDKLMIRENTGYDFAAWRDGIKSIGWNNIEKYDTLTLLNDTSYFPLFPINETIQKFNSSKKNDFWGATIHSKTETGMPGTDGPVPEHVQSYFMTFKQSVIKSHAFQNFWNTIKDLENVHDVIGKYETRLTGLLANKGFKYDAIYNPQKSGDNVRDAVYEIPSELIKRHFPFLKVKVINYDNRQEILATLASNKSQYPHEYIGGRIRFGKSKKILRRIKNKIRRLINRLKNRLFFR